MIKGKKILALIPARSGSKRLPGKNIKGLSGKPLIAWTIEQAKNSKYIDKIIVSTDSQEIAEISKEYGAEIPFLRPGELAQDESKGIDVILHAINWFKQRNEHYDLLIQLQPTSPLREPEDIDKAVELLFAKNAKAIITVTEAQCSPSWVNTLPEDGSMKNFLLSEDRNKNSQQFSKFYRLNGAVYLGYCDYILEQKSFHGEASFAYIMPKMRSVDIDDEFDFMFAEFLMENNIDT